MTTDIPAIIDTHSHLHGEVFEADFEEILQRADAAAISKIALVGVDPDDTDRALSLARRHGTRFIVIAGLHPHESAKWNPETAARLKSQIAENPDIICAVGEMGLDYHYDFAPRDLQREAFIGQMEIARDAHLPIVIHCREAYDDCLAMLRDFYGATPSPADKPRGILHCYFGTVEQAHEAIELGFLLGIGGSCTFKNAADVHAVVAQTPLEHLVLETDAPYMAPVPFRGKRNESSYLTHVAARVAELKNLDPAIVIRTTTDNASMLFAT